MTPSSDTNSLATIFRISIFRISISFHFLTLVLVDCCAWLDFLIS